MFQKNSRAGRLGELPSRGTVGGTEEWLAQSGCGSPVPLPQTRPYAALPSGC